MITFNENSKYLIWFEQTIDQTQIEDLRTKLINLGVKFEIVNGLKRPAIIEFGNKPSTQVPKIGMVKQ